MRKLVLKMEVSLDGFVGTPSGDVDWIFSSIDDEVSEEIVDVLRQAGTHIMGRVTYEDMAAHWPASSEVFAPPMNEIPKVVFSRTLDEATWPESRIARGDLAAEVGRLKREPGKDILAHGGSGFAQSLSKLGLVDEYRLDVHPVVLGSGLPLFADPIRLKLLSAKTFATGLLALVYERA
jgi:dihydrofolate reductase